MQALFALPRVYQMWLVLEDAGWLPSETWMACVCLYIYEREREEGGREAGRERRGRKEREWRERKEGGEGEREGGRKRRERILNL